MMRFRHFILCVSVVFIASITSQSQFKFSYEKNTFISYFNCLGIYPGTSLKRNEKVLFFSDKQIPGVVKIANLIGAKEAEQRFKVLGFDKVYADKRLWAEIGCVHSFRGDMPESLARMSPQPKDSVSFGLALRGLPAGAWISSGKGDSAAMKIKGNPYLRVVRPFLTNDCYSSGSLIRVKKFPVRKGHTIVQLDIGKVKRLSPEKRRQKIEEELKQAESLYQKWAWLKYKPKIKKELEQIDYFESVEICRFFLDGKRILKKKKITRRTGVEERVDTAPDLNADNWADTTDTAIGFISLNQGKDWDVVLVDAGWEGIYYLIERLNGSAIHYKRYLYTYH